MQDKCVSRRDFLKITGVAGATIGLGAGLGGLVAACGGTEGTSTTATAQATTTSTVASTSTSIAESTTTVSAGPEAGRDIILGLVSPSTGPLALFAKADDWWVDFAHEGRPGRDHRWRRQEAHDPDQAGRQPVRHEPRLPGGRRPRSTTTRSTS